MAFSTSTILAHCVPLPAPGPPKTKITFGNSTDIFVLMFVMFLKPRLLVTQPILMIEKTRKNNGQSVCTELDRYR